MPCFSPLLAWRLKNPDPGGKSRIFFHLPDGIHTGSTDFCSPGSPFEPVKLPCGRCIGCRLERSRQWALRCVLEAKSWPENCFITLTYDDNHLPKHKSLMPKDLQLFFKRLRKSLGDKKIRYFACGEYGEKTQRPHYHAIIFNHDFKDRYRTVCSDTVSYVGISKELADLWPYGFSSVGNMTFEAAAYVARYCLKKYYGDPAKVAAHYNGRKPEFVVMSRRPGIASAWFDKFGLTDVAPYDQCLCRGKKCKPPRYFDKLLEQIDAELLKHNKDLREIRGKQREISVEELNRRHEFVKTKTEFNRRRKL